MKKLMIAAAAAAMVGGAFAWDFSGLYNLKFTLKTLAPKQTTCSKTDCTICDPATRSEGNYYENGTVKLEGIIAYCSLCDYVGESYSTGYLALWDPTNKEPLYFNNAWKTAKTVYALAGLENVAVSNVFKSIDTTVYGKSSNKVGMDFVMDYADNGLRDLYTNYVDDAGTVIPVLATKGVWDLRAAGLGTYCWMDDGNTSAKDKNLGYVKSVSGNVAGRIPAATGYTGTKGSGNYWGATIVANECMGAADYCGISYKAAQELPIPGIGGNWELPILEETDWSVEKDNYSVPAYGTWSIKRNESATKKELYKSLPSYAQNF